MYICFRNLIFLQIVDKDPLFTMIALSLKHYDRFVGQRRHVILVNFTEYWNFGINFLEVARGNRNASSSSQLLGCAARRRCNRHLSVTLMSAGDATGRLPGAASL